MRVGILLYPFGEKKPAGLGAYVLNLTLALVKEKPTWHFYLFTKGVHPTDVFSEFSNVTVVPVGGYFLWKDVAYLTYRKQVDVWLYNNPNLPVFVTPKRSVVTALDFGIFYPKEELTTRERIDREFLRWAQHSALRRTTHIACTSYATKDDVHHFFPDVPLGKASVVMCGFTRVCEVYEADATLEVPPYYYLVVGVIKLRKNQLTAVQAFIKAKEMGLIGKLLICGKGKGAYFDTLMEAITNTKYKEDIVYLGYRSNEELVTLYQHARALIFPSYVEGFGMPIMEAMSCGTPVITSSNGALGEAAGGAALTADSSDVEGFAHAMLTFADDTVRDAYIKKGYERAKEFSWERSAREYVSVFENVQ